MDNAWKELEFEDVVVKNIREQLRIVDAELAVGRLKMIPTIKLINMLRSFPDAPPTKKKVCEDELD